jgi:ATP synthase protein I
MLDPTKPLRTVLGWQVGATVFLAFISAWLAGVHGTLSVMLGGAVGMLGSLTFALLARPRKALVQDSTMAWDKLGQVLKAEGAKVLVMVVSLWLILMTYKEVVLIGFIGTFILSVIIFSMAIFLRNPMTLEARQE